MILLNGIWPAGRDIAYYYCANVSASSKWTSCTSCILLFILCSFLNGHNLTTALLVVTQGILFQNFFPTLVNMFVVTITLVSETIQFNKIVWSKTIEHIGNILVSLSEVTGCEGIIYVWTEVLLIGAQTFRTIHKYPACTKHHRIFGQRIGFNGERINFCSGGVKPKNSFESIGYVSLMNLISEIIAVIKLTSLQTSSWVSLQYASIGTILIKRRLSAVMWLKELSKRWKNDR